MRLHGTTAVLHDAESFVSVSCDRDLEDSLNIAVVLKEVDN